MQLESGAGFLMLRTRPVTFSLQKVRKRRIIRQRGRQTQVKAELELPFVTKHHSPDNDKDKSPSTRRAGLTFAAVCYRTLQLTMHDLFPLTISVTSSLYFNMGNNRRRIVSV